MHIVCCSFLIFLFYPLCLVCLFFLCLYLNLNLYSVRPTCHLFDFTCLIALPHHCLEKAIYYVYLSATIRTFHFILTVRKHRLE